MNNRKEVSLAECIREGKNTQLTYIITTDKGTNIKVRTGPRKPGKSWNLKISIPGLESPGICIEVLDLESPGIQTYRSIFLIISGEEFSHYTSSEIWVYLVKSVKSL